MNKTNLIICLTSLILLTSCGGTKYTKTVDPKESQGIRLESSEVLTMYEDTFKLELIDTVTYSETAASRIGVTGKVSEKKTKVYTGTFTVKSGILSGATIYNLQSTQLKYSIRISDVGKDGYKSIVYDREKSNYNAEDAQKLVDGKTLTKEVSNSWNVTLDSVNETFSYAIGL